MPSKNHFHIRTADEVVDTSVDIEVDVGTAADVEAVMRKYDRESNTRTWEGTPGIVVRVIMVIFSLYCIWSTLFSVAAIEKRLTAFIACVIIMGYMTYPASKHHVRHNYIPWFDYVLMIVGAASFFYYCFVYDSLVMVLTSASKITPFQIAVGIIGILCLMELCRRCVGVPILCVAAALIIYTFAIGTPLKRVLYTLFYTTSGVMGTPIQVCAKYIVVFIIFGAFLERTGIAAFFIDLANSLVGRFSGGPAKVAVISSALCGMVSGSSVGNTVTTGSVTIPMMKKTGYKPEFAGAVEAAASTGGQIMPPIMGAAAFLMAEYMNVTYGEVALRAILPAVLYFTGIFIAVHLEAKKLRLSGIPKEELPVMSKLIRKIYLLLPLVVLVWLVTTNTRTMQFSATVAILVAIVVSLFDKDNRITPAKIFEALEAGGKGTITVAVACCMAGIIAGCITATGLASKLISAVVSISNQVSFVNPQFIAMFLTMICCIILGMGVPTTANYCIMASTCAPILITMGVPKICAHFFVFYFGIVADITPPVALAAYAGSAIAKSNPMKTGINATKLAIGAFIVPYIFCLNPAMLLIDVTAFGIIQIVITSLVGIFGVAAAMNGFLFKKLEWPCRVLICIGGLLMMDPTAITDVIGIVLFAAVFAWQYFGAKKERAAACKY
ncbi:MAG: C4-dicarboxylate ABC transporter [Clostridiales bacterium]|nr:MAG: C4-dicarboxylate ABC transporter [Clostridiales bacterium]